MDIVVQKVAKINYLFHLYLNLTPIRVETYYLYNLKNTIFFNKKKTYIIATSAIFQILCVSNKKMKDL